MAYDYIIVGGGLAGASAIEGIRAHDPKGSVLLLSRENHPPYHRPPLSKDLWFGKSTPDKLPYRSPEYYRENGVELGLRKDIVELDTERRMLWDDHGATYEYGKLLLATGGTPRRLNVPGADHETVHYFRYLEDYLYLQERVGRVRHALVIGAGFIGMEIAAALRHAGVDVTLLFPDPYPLHRVLPRDLGFFVADYYRQKGVEAVSGEAVIRFEDAGGEIVAYTNGGNSVTTDLVVAGVGIEAGTDLAEGAGLEASSGGIEVDEYGCTTDPNIYSAGDVAVYPCLPIQRRLRTEHWDHAIQHGKAVGANMAGAHKAYDYLPFFYSDLFDLGWEAVGEVESHLDTHAVWKQEHREGVVYYLWDEVVQGVLLWNTWGAVDWARGMIQARKPTTREEREAAVPASS